jgi:glycerol kinase
MKYLMALDQGTTSSRCIIFDSKGRIVSSAAKEFTQHFPKAGWVEHDAEDIFESQLFCAREALRSSGLSPTEIAAIGITNQRETTVVWEKSSGKPICPAIVWQCRRTANVCEALVQKGLDRMIKEKRDLPPTPTSLLQSCNGSLTTLKAREIAPKRESCCSAP